MSTIGTAIPAHAASINLVSVSSDGITPGNRGSQDPAISSDGRYIAFGSGSNNLSTDKTVDGNNDVFVRDTVNKTTKLVSAVNGTTKPGDSDSGGPVFSSTGRFIAFLSNATNLDGTKSNGTFFSDIYLRDTATNTTTLISARNGSTTSGNKNSFYPSVSSDGRYVVFASGASDLVANDTNGFQDVFIRDVQTQTTKLVSVGTNGTSFGTGNSGYPTITSDGRYVVFYSNAANLTSNKTTSTYYDVFVRDLQTSTTKLITVSSTGNVSGNGASFTGTITSDGRYVTFYSNATNLTANKTTNTNYDVFVRDTVSNTTTLVSVNSGGTTSGSGTSQLPTMSSDGRYITFSSNATNLIRTKTSGTYYDIFVRDTVSKTTTLVTLSTDGTTSGNGNSRNPGISSDGRYITFYSYATNLNPNKTYDNPDVFVWDRLGKASPPVGGLISEFRERGNGGATDEYVELYNTTSSPLDINGWTLLYTSGGVTQKVTIASTTKVPALGHYLLTGSGYSLANYGGTNAAKGDQSFSADIDDGSPLTLANSAGTVEDPITFYIGTNNIAGAPIEDGQYAFVRQANATTSLPVTTANAFILVQTTNFGFDSSGGGYVIPALGAPGPENLSSPTALMPLKVTLFDPATSQSANPNRVRNTAATGTNATNGTLSIRRLVTNNTGAPITKLRFRIVNLTTLNSSGYGTSTQCDLRAIASANSIINGVTVYGTKPDTTIAQSFGGGNNSSSVETSSGVVTLSAAIPAGGSRAYDFTFGVVRPGTFSILLLFEGVTGTSGGTSGNNITGTGNNLVAKPPTVAK